MASSEIITNDDKRMKTSKQNCSSWHKDAERRFPNLFAKVIVDYD